MEPDVWLNFYDEICREFGFDKEKDLESARLLAGLVVGKSERSLEEVRGGFPSLVQICGGAASLPDELAAEHIDGYVVAADGASSTLMEAGIVPDMIVTDLDGLIEDQIELNQGGSVVFVHAHGDNQPAIRKYVPLFSGPVVGTCQCPPPPSLFNFGGFTDGDRAACICAELGASTIVLRGFDFDVPTDKLGRSKEVKARKLQWARRIIDYLGSHGVRIECSAIRV